MTMPSMNGIQLARAFREIREKFPVILCTGFSEQINPENAGDSGIDGYLPKPFSIRDIAMAIKRALGGDDEGENSK